MAIIQFDNGQKVKFDGTPTERDVEEVAQKLGITKKKSFFQKAGDFFTSSTQKFAKTLGTAASVIDPKTKKLREETISSTQKLVDEYTQKAKNEPNKERAKKFLEVAQKLADTENIDIYNNPEYQKTAKQIYGEALGTVLETTSLGSFGASKAPTALKILTPGKNILKNAKIGAAYGGVFGTGFGVSGAAQKNKSSKDIITEGLIAGAVGATGGATLGGALTSAGFGLSGILKKTSKYSAQMKNALGKEAIKKLEKTSKDLVKMSPTASKNEAKWNKNTARFIANEFVIDEKTLKPKSILQLIDSDGKRINTDNAINALKNKYYDEANAFNSLIQDSGEYISLNQLKTKAIKSLGDDLKARGSDYDEAIKYINKEINAYKKNYRDAGLIDGNDLLLPISKLNKIKTGLWNKTSNFNPSQKDKLLSDINYKLGQTAKDLIEESVEDVAVKRMNQRLGDFASAIKVLENANGKVLPGGFFGRQFTRLAGTVAGSPGGIGGSIIGNITGGMLADIMVNPKIKTTLWTKLVKQLNKQKNGQDIINEAIEILSKRNQERAARKLLEAPKFIPLKPKSDNSRLFTQEEANALLESLKIKPKKIKLNQTGKAEPLKSKQKLDSLNPTGSVFSKYTPKQRATAELADNITTLDKTMKKPADEMITIYRGTGKGGDIVAGDFVTTNKQLAKDYAGTGRVIEKKVRLSDVLDDLDEPLGEEYIYRPQAKLKPSVEPLIEEAKKYKTAEEFVKENSIKHISQEQVLPKKQGDIQFYHGTDVLNYDKLSIPKFEGSTMDRNYGDYFYITPDRSLTETYGRYSAGFNIPKEKVLPLEKYRSLWNAEKGTGISEKAFDDKLFKDYWAIEMPDNEFIVKDVSKIRDYTKSQLTDIWNKANKK